MKVWIIIRDCYEDYEILEVHGDRDIAKKRLKKMKEKKNDIYEYSYYIKCLTLRNMKGSSPGGKDGNNE